VDFDCGGLTSKPGGKYCAASRPESRSYIEKDSWKEAICVPRTSENNYNELPEYTLRATLRYVGDQRSASRGAERCAKEVKYLRLALGVFAALACQAQVSRDVWPKKQQIVRLIILRRPY
jgi:hypothetical protein